MDRHMGAGMARYQSTSPGGAGKSSICVAYSVSHLVRSICRAQLRKLEAVAVGFLDLHLAPSAVCGVSLLDRRLPHQHRCADVRDSHNPTRRFTSCTSTTWPLGKWASETEPPISCLTDNVLLAALMRLPSRRIVRVAGLPTATPENFPIFIGLGLIAMGFFLLGYRRNLYLASQWFLRYPDKGFRYTLVHFVCPAILIGGGVVLVVTAAH